MIRFQFGNHSRWLSTFDRWDLQDDISSVKTLEQIFKHIGLGVAPTPSSLGRRSMRYVYDKYNLERHTALPLSCENWFLKYDFGGIAISNYIGETFDEVSQLDEKQNYVSVFDIHPDGTAEWFVDEPKIYSTYFARVRISIKDLLPLGVFPVRKGRHRVIYPTQEGEYETYIWRENIDACRASGCDVEVLEGWGWPKMTTDNKAWTEWIYQKRLTSPDPQVEKGVKKIAVSAIGSHGRSRVNYAIVGDEIYDSATDFPVVEAGLPYNLWVHPVRDDRSATMDHWRSFTVARANLGVRRFAYRFAKEDRLLLIDYDSVFAKPGGESESFIHKGTQEAKVARPGEWIYSQHHEFQILRNRMWVSKEEPLRYGSLLKGVKNGQRIA